MDNTHNCFLCKAFLLVDRDKVYPCRSVFMKFPQGCIHAYQSRYDYTLLNHFDKSFEQLKPLKIYQQTISSPRCTLYTFPWMF